MKIRDQNVHPSANFAKEVIPVRLITAISQTSVVAESYTPGNKFQIVKVSSWCSAKAGTVTAVVKVGGRVAASVTFTAGTENVPTLSTTLANLRGSATEAITVEYTTDGTGALTNGMINIVYRPRPMAGDLGPV